MIIIGVVLAVLALGAGAAWAVARLDVPGVDEATGSQSAEPLPAGPLRPGDVDGVRFNQAVRGYRMGQVDRALTRLADELLDRDREITRLRAEVHALSGGPAAVDDTTTTVQDEGFDR